MGENFRLVEPPSQSINIMENCCLLEDSLHWIPSTSGLVYEDELVKIIVNDLLKYTNEAFTNNASIGNSNRKNRLEHVQSISPLIPKFSRRHSSDADAKLQVEGIEEMKDIITAPPLPPPRQTFRSHSFSDTRDMAVDNGIKTKSAGSRHSEIIELPGSSYMDDKMQFGGQTQVQGRKHHPTVLSKRKGILGKILTRGVKSPSHSRKQGHKHHLNSINDTDMSPDSTASPPSSPARFFSPLPEHLNDKIKEEFSSCTEKVLPLKYLARLIDTPGNLSYKVLQSLFLTENSICTVVFDMSRDILSPVSLSATSSRLLKRMGSLGSKPRMPSVSESEQVELSSPVLPDSLDNSYLYHVMAEIGNICMQWSGSKSDLTVRGPRIILVGTHSDEVPSSFMHRNFEILRDEIRASPYKKYVAIVKFSISNSSIIERSSMDDLKKFMKETVKKCCRQQVPLKWLRCMRRFQGFLTKNYFVGLIEAKKLVSEICDISPITDPEIDEVLHFLHQNHLIMHFPQVHPLRDIIITCTWWFAQQVSALFGAALVDIEAQQGPLELLPDQQQLKSSGILSNQLLDYVWQEKETQRNKDMILTVMNKMDLLCVMTSDFQLITLAAAFEELTRNTSGSKNSLPRHHYSVPVSCIVVPALVEESHPPQLTNLPSFDVEPIIFRFKDHIPNGLFYRLLCRCVQSFPKHFRLYQHAATFEFNESLLIMLIEGRREISLTLHPISNNSTCSSSTSSLHTNRLNMEHSGNEETPTEILNSLPSLCENPSVSPDVCMTVLMFTQATLSDIIQQWTPHLDFDLCIKCDCKATPIPMDAVVDIDAALAQMTQGGTLRRLASFANTHYIILNDVGGTALHHVTLRCEQGSQVPMSASTLCWFGEIPSGEMSPVSHVKDIGKDLNFKIKRKKKKKKKDFK